MKSQADPQDLVPLFHHRWAVPVLAELWRLGGGAKFVTLSSRLGLPRESLKRVLVALVEARLVRPNPGYGHPMRPEYLATARGARVGEGCADLLARLRQDGEGGARGASLRKWPLPVLLALGGAGGRFNRVRERLPEITPRAFSGALRELVVRGLAERAVSSGPPPGTTYRPTAAGRRLQPRLARLARLARGR